MRKLYLSFLPLIFVFTVSAQTTIIDPAGAGGFEAGNTFAANGWTVVNGATNQWFVGPLAVPSAGTNSAYISQDPAGAVYTYNITSSSVVYFYRDVTFPAGLNDIVLSFKWKAQGESTWDWIAVWSAPTSVTPVVNLPSAGSASWNNVPTTYPGAELHGVQPYNLQGTYQTATICLPASYAGTTRRLVFMWSNDGSVGTQPPASIDEISLVSSTPAAPTAQPTALVLTATSSSQIDGSFTAATGSPSGYLVVRYPTGATPVAPVNGTTYLAGSALGTGTVVSAGPGTTFTSAFLSAGTGYDFYVYAFSTTSACAGPQYNVTTPLMGTQTTPGCTGLAGGTYSVGPTGTYPTLTAAITAISGGITGPVILELQAAYTSAAETFPITFPFNNCITATNTLTIRPAAGATNLQITSAATPATIDFNGAKYVTIDGRPGGTGTAIQLSVINTATAGAAIRFINDASNNTVTYTDVQGQNTSATSSSVSGVIYFSTANTTSLQGNDNNTISFSRIHATTGGTPAIGISASGTTTSAVTYNDNNIITNNWIYDYFSASLASSGIKVDAGNSTWTISNNSFYQTASRSVTSAAVANRGIWVTPNTGSLAPQASGFIITGNYIGGDAANAAGNPYTITSTTSAQFYGMDISVGHGAPTSVQGNTITNIDFTSTSTNNPFFSGISVANGHVNIGTATGNTIGSGTGNGAITITANGSGGTIYGIRLSGGTNTIMNVSNNTVGSITMGGTVSKNFVGIGAVGGTSTTVTISNNLVGSLTTANSIDLASAGTTTSQSMTGIQVSSGATTSTISGNTVANLFNRYTSTGVAGYVRGIAVNVSATTVTGNTIRDLSTTTPQVGTGSSSSVQGIAVTSSTPGHTVSGNIIHSLVQKSTSTTAAVQVTGLYYSGATTGTNSITKNFIHSLDVEAVNPAAVITGIDIAGGASTYANNMIRLGIRPDGSSITTALTIRGISINSTGANNIYFNSVYIGGTGVATGTNSTYAFNRTSTIGVHDIRNNVLVNDRSNATTGANHYVIRLVAATTAFPTFNYNLYRYTGTGGTFAINGTTDVPVYVPGWLAGDDNSNTNNPLFVNATGSAATVNLHVQTGSAVESAGIDIPSITDDYDSQVRATLSPVDIGADAGDFALAGADVGITSLLTPAVTECYSNAETVTVVLRNFSASILDFAIQPVTVTVTATGPVAYNSIVVINTGTLAPSASMNVVMPATYDMSALGTYTFNATATVAGDLNPANNAITPANRIAAIDGGTATASPAQYCVTGGTPTLTLAGADGGPIQWQQSASATGPWTNVGTNSATYVPATAITTTMYYRAYVACGINSDTSNVVTVTLNQPAVLTTTAGSRCGPGTVVLGATASAGSTLHWYTTATGGTSVATGPFFTTPVLNTTTTYYVSAESGTGQSLVTVGAGASTSTSYESPYYHLWGGKRSQYLIRASELTAAGMSAGNINTLAFDVVSPGTTYNNFSISLKHTTATVMTSTLETGLTTVFTVPSVTPVAGVNTYTFQNTFAWDGSSNLIVEVCWSNNNTGGTSASVRMDNVGFVAHAYYRNDNQASGVICNTTSATSTQSLRPKMIFTTGCSSARQAVTATVTPGPAFALSQQNLTICNNAIKQLSVTSPTANFDSYVWSPSANLFTDAAATVPYTGGSATTVYLKTATGGEYTFIATATNSTTQCSGIDSVKVTVLPVLAVAASPSNLCVSGTSTLTLTPGTGLGTATFQWYTSTDGTNFTAIANATGTSFTTPTLTATTHYRAEVKDAAGNVCQQPTVTINVNSPQVLTTTPNGICTSSGTVTLGATSSAGTQLYWYANATGGIPLDSGTTFTTPNISATTTYYVSAGSASASSLVGLAPTATNCGTIAAATAANFALRFNTTGPVVLNSAWVIPTAAGNFVVALRLAGSGTDLQLASFNITPAMVNQPTQITFNWAIDDPGSYQLINIQGNAHRIATFTCSYPMTAGSFSIVGSAASSTGATNTNTYNTFFWLNVTERCESPRVPVIATVNAITTINSQPQSQAVCAGANVTFSVAAVGANLTYQWQLNGTNIAGATNATYVINNSSPANNGNYAVVITGLCGTVTSSVATLSVSPSNAWLGAVSSDWATPANWCGGVPNSTTDVVIPSGTPYAPVISGFADARNITINSGATLTTASTATFSIYGNLVNNGTINASSGFIFFKGTAPQTTTAITANTIVINGAGVTLNGNMTVQTLILENGNLTLGANNVSFAGSVNGSLSAHIVTNGTGSAISRTVGAGPVTIPVGPDATTYNPVIIANGQGRDFTVRVSTGVSPSITDNSFAVNRTWSVIPSTALPASAQITFQYDNAHGNSNFAAAPVVEVGIHNGAIWKIATPPNGIAALGPATARRVTISANEAGTFVITRPGGITYPTSIVSVNPDITGIILMPNAVQSQTTLRITARRAMKVNWNVVDAAGRVVMTFNSQLTAGTTDIRLDFTRLKSGMYFIAGMTSSGKADVVRFIKL